MWHTIERFLTDMPLMQIFACFAILAMVIVMAMNRLEKSSAEREELVAEYDEFE